MSGDRDIDLEIAMRVFGWEEISGTSKFTRPDSAIKGSVWLEQDLPFFSSDIAAAMQVEDRIAELGLQSVYYEALVSIVATSITERLFQHFDVVHASAKQRCQAALAALKDQRQ